MFARTGVRVFIRDGTKSEKLEKRPRGRPRAYEPEMEMKQATDAFWKAGYAGTLFDDISAATGMNRLSLRAAFGDKHAIYVKALREYWEFKFAAMRKALAGGGTLDEVLMRVYDVALSIYLSGEGDAREKRLRRRDGGDRSRRRSLIPPDHLHGFSHDRRRFRGASQGGS